MIDERYECPHCNGWKNTMRYMPDNQGEFYVLCDDCHKVSSLPDHEIVAELKMLRARIDGALDDLIVRNWMPGEGDPPAASRVRA